jgi:hypothetical protein
MTTPDVAAALDRLRDAMTSPFIQEAMQRAMTADLALVTQALANARAQAIEACALIVQAQMAGRTDRENHALRIIAEKILALLPPPDPTPDPRPRAGMEE